MTRRSPTGDKSTDDINGIDTLIDGFVGETPNTFTTVHICEDDNVDETAELVQKLELVNKFDAAERREVESQPALPIATEIPQTDELAVEAYGHQRWVVCDLADAVNLGEAR